MPRAFPTIADIEAGLASGDRAIIGRALTLVESKHPDHRSMASELLLRLSAHPPLATQRVGITGAPGVGKSTFIDALGIQLTAAGHRVAVLAVDPSSERTGGSILGDKTRMARLCVDPNAFIRPSPAGRTLGGIAARTREMMLVLEAAGFDIVLIETVGVGQSETAVRHLSDTFVLLALAGAGDELQGIKRGIMELADVVLVTKADGDNVIAAKRAAAQLRGALRLLHTTLEDHTWLPPVLSVSALPNARNSLAMHAGPSSLAPRQPMRLAFGAAPRPRAPRFANSATAAEGDTSNMPDASMIAAWDAVAKHHARLASTDRLARQRADQALRWLWTLVDERVRESVRRHPDSAAIERAVRENALTVEAAADLLVKSLTT